MEKVDPASILFHLDSKGLALVHSLISISTIAPVVSRPVVKAAKVLSHLQKYERTHLCSFI